MSTYDEFEDRSESLALLEEEMMKYLLIEAVNAKKAEVFENVVFEGKRRYYIEDLSVRDYTLENTTPYQLQLFDTVIEETSWGELLRKVSLFLLERFPEYMDTITDFRCQWTKQVMYSREKKTNYKVLTEELFINVNHTALHSCWFLQDLLDYFKNKNIWMWAAFDNEGFDCLDINSLYGSAIIGDTLFLCETNGVEIEVDGEQVDPESALEDYPISALSKYIKDVTNKAIEKNIDEYVIKGFKYDKWAPDLIKKYDFTDMVDDYLELTN